jgi:hypothetical protein
MIAPAPHSWPPTRCDRGRCLTADAESVLPESSSATTQLFRDIVGSLHPCMVHGLDPVFSGRACEALHKLVGSAVLVELSLYGETQGTGAKGFMCWG